MFKYTLLNISPCLRCAFKRSLHNNADTIVVASAVRTPWGKCNGQLASVSAWQLGQMAVEAAVKQSAVPLEAVKHIIMAEYSPTQREKEITFSDFLKKSKYYGIKSENGVSTTSLVKALDILKSKSEDVVVIGGMGSATQRGSLIGEQNEILKAKSVMGGMESSTQQGLLMDQQNNILKASMKFADISSDDIKNYIINSKAKFSKAEREALFDAELVPLNVRQVDGKRKIMREVKQDEISLEPRQDCLTLHNSDGASAFVLTTWSKAEALNLSPLAEIIGYEHITNVETIFHTARKCLENLFVKSQTAINNIHHWEIDDCVPELVVYLKQHLKLNMEIVNPHGGSSVIGHSPVISLPRLVTHLTHALKPKQYGCIVSSTSQETFSLILKKLPTLSHAHRLPLLTLYTKDPCPLCDILVEELELNFSGEYEVEKVFIDTKENIRYLRLFRQDIPVVFLNNQFLCMHRLNHKLLRQKLNLLKEQ